MIDSHQMNVFLVAAETLNFTATAKRVQMTQPSVSQHIQSLENYFGTALFLRNGKNLEMTDAGLLLVPLAREMVNLSNRIDETMASAKGVVSGHLHVGCSTTPGKYLLPVLLASFHQKYPGVRATCHVYGQPQIHRMMAEGGVQFALSSAPMSDVRDMDFREFMRDEIQMIVPNDHPWASRGEIEPEELYQGVFIMREEQSGTQIAMRQALEKAGISVGNLNVLLTLGNSEGIALAVQQCLGVGFVSQIVVLRLGQNRVTPVRIRGVELYREIYFGRSTRRQFTAAQNAFWDFVTTNGGPIIEHISAEESRQD